MTKRPSVRAISRPRRKTASAAFALQGRSEERRPIAALLERPLAIAFIATLGVLAALVLGVAIGSITTILVYIVLALFVALGLDPVVRILERRGLKRSGAITIVFGLFLLLVVMLFVFLLPPIIAQIGQFLQAIPAAVAGLETSPWVLALPPDAQDAVSVALVQLAEVVSRQDVFAAIGGGALAIGVGVVSAVSASLIVVALSLYFLSSLTSMKGALVALAPAHSRPRLAEMTERVTASVGSSLLGSVTLAAINACVVFGLHLLIRLPYPALMAAVAFVITLIPLFGSIIFLVIGSFVALLSSPTQALVFAVCYLIYIQLEAYVVTPRVMNRAIEIPAALVLIGALVGGTLLGILGVLIALPVTATILLIIREVVVPRQDLKIRPGPPAG